MKLFKRNPEKPGGSGSDAGVKRRQALQTVALITSGFAASQISTAIGANINGEEQHPQPFVPKEIIPGIDRLQFNFSEAGLTQFLPIYLALEQLSADFAPHPYLASLKSTIYSPNTGLQLKEAFGNFQQVRCPALSCIA